MLLSRPRPMLLPKLPLRKLLPRKLLPRKPPLPKRRPRKPLPRLPLLQAKRDDVKEFAAVTHTPLYLITPDDANGSAAGAGLLREALTCKVRDRRARVTPSLKLLWRIVFAMDGNKTRGNKIKLHWGPIEFNSLAEKGSASAQATGVLSRRRILSEVWEMEPQDIEDNEIELAAQSMLDGAAPAPEPATAPPEQVNPVGEPAVA